MPERGKKRCVDTIAFTASIAEGLMLWTINYQTSALKVRERFGKMQELPVKTTLFSVAHAVYPAYCQNATNLRHFSLSSNHNRFAADCNTLEPAVLVLIVEAVNFRKCPTCSRADSNTPQNSKICKKLPVPLANAPEMGYNDPQHVSV